MRKLESLPPVKPWEKGVTVSGYFMSVDPARNEDSSPVINLDRTGKKDFVSCYSPVILVGYIKQAKVGEFVKIVCKGKTLATAGGKAWDFDFYILDSEKEIEEAIRVSSITTEIVR